MIDTLFFVFQIIGVLVLVGWAVVHDRKAQGEPTAGPLAFKPSGAGTGDLSGERRRRIGLTRSPSDANLNDRRR